eukprot:2035586-Rhodomonas_salina.1
MRCSSVPHVTSHHTLSQYWTPQALWYHTLTQYRTSHRTVRYVYTGSCVVHALSHTAYAISYLILHSHCRHCTAAYPRYATILLAFLCVS